MVHTSKGSGLPQAQPTSAEGRLGQLLAHPSQSPNYSKSLIRISRYGTYFWLQEKFRSESGSARILPLARPICIPSNNTFNVLLVIVTNS